MYECGTVLCKGAVTWLSGVNIVYSGSWAAPIKQPYSPWNLRNHLGMTKLQLFVQKNLSSNHCCISVITNKKNEYWKTGRLASFKKTVIAIYFSLPQVCLSLLPFVMLCHLYPLPTFWAVTVMFHSIWWQLHVYWFLVNILWHSFFYGNSFFCKIPWLFLDLNKKFVFPWDMYIYFGLQWWPCSLIIIYLLNIIIFFSDAN